MFCALSDLKVSFFFSSVYLCKLSWADSTLNSVMFFSHQISHRHVFLLRSPAINLAKVSEHQPYHSPSVCCLSISSTKQLVFTLNPDSLKPLRQRQTPCRICVPSLSKSPKAGLHCPHVSWHSGLPNFQNSPLISAYSILKLLPSTVPNSSM